MLDFIVNQVLALLVLASFSMTLKLFFDFKNHQCKSRGQTSPWKVSLLMPLFFVASTLYIHTALLKWSKLHGMQAHAASLAERDSEWAPQCGGDSR